MATITTNDLKILENGTWQTPSNISVFDDTTQAFKSAQAVYVYRNGTWEQVWPPLTKTTAAMSPEYTFVATVAGIDKIFFADITANAWIEMPADLTGTITSFDSAKHILPMVEPAYDIINSTTNPILAYDSVVVAGGQVYNNGGVATAAAYQHIANTVSASGAYPTIAGGQAFGAMGKINDFKVTRTTQNYVDGRGFVYDYKFTGVTENGYVLEYNQMFDGVNRAWKFSNASIVYPEAGFTGCNYIAQSSTHEAQGATGVIACDNGKFITSSTILNNFVYKNDDGSIAPNKIVNNTKWIYHDSGFDVNFNTSGGSQGTVAGDSGFVGRLRSGIGNDGNTIYTWIEEQTGYNYGYPNAVRWHSYGFTDNINKIIRLNTENASATWAVTGFNGVIDIMVGDNGFFALGGQPTMYPDGTGTFNSQDPTHVWTKITTGLTEDIVDVIFNWYSKTINSVFYNKLELLIMTRNGKIYRALQNGSTWGTSWQQVYVPGGITGFKAGTCTRNRPL